MMLDMFNVQLKQYLSTFIYDSKPSLVGIALNLAICLPLAATLNIWIDEYYSLSTSSGDIGYAIRQAAFFELQPPLYFVLLSLWTKLNHSIFFARCLSIIFVTTTIYLSGLISKRYLSGITQAWLPILVALNPFTIYAAIECRPPALGILLSALMILFLFDGYLSCQPNVKSQRLYIIVTILAIYTQYYLTLLLAAHCIVIIALKRREKVKTYFIGIVIITLFLLPIFVLLPSQLSTHSQFFTSAVVERNLQNFSAFEGFNLGFERFTSFQIPSNLFANQDLWKFFRLGFLSLLVFGFIKYRCQFSETDISIWLTGTLLIILAIPLYFLSGAAQMQDRHLTVLFLPALMVLCLLFKFLLVDVSRPKLKWIIGLVPFIFVYLFGLYTNYKLMTKPGDWRRVATYIEQIEGKNNPIIVFNGHLAPLLQYYYQGSNPVFPFANEPYFSDLSAMKYLDAGEVLSKIRAKRGNASTLILVNYNYYLYKFNKKEGVNASNANDPSNKKLNVSDSNLMTLETVVKDYYTIEAQKDFFSTRVRVLRPKTP
jgi:hypothetical protein